MNTHRTACLPVFSRVCFAALACLTLVLGMPARAQSLGTPASPLPGRSFQPSEIIDAQVVGQPVVAIILQVPAGWVSRGGVNWDRRTQCAANQMRIEWMAGTPDGAEAFEIMHGFSWQVQGTQIQMNPCPAAPYQSAQSFLQGVVQQRRTGARILEYRNRPEAAEAAAKASTPHPQVRQRHEAGQMLIGYQAGGHYMRELLSTSVTFSEVQGNIMGGAGLVTALRAPDGRFDAALAEQIASSMRPNPHWMTLSQQSAGNAERQFSQNQRRQIDAWHAAEMAKINAKGAADRAAIRADANREVGRIHAETYAHGQATNDRIHRGNLEALGEYNTYRDSSGAVVRSSIHGGDRVLRLPNGEYTSTSDPYFNPAGSEELKRVR
jgi:hypothetical protein